MEAQTRLISCIMNGAREHPPLFFFFLFPGYRSTMTLCSSQLIQCNFQLVWSRPRSPSKIKEELNKKHREELDTGAKMEE